ncbi:hypothetical protein Kpol_538p12 [Vanderwaltozyma polyspora DSM 70294]|uniref:PH domain-containing protein n=1 Tax=Vanderwaltozyma polyspora (strain ATCC 22028 / DSM 70294 / BCRC 21397 / CBS 2163 / NBRC 10782 / NRRL Y-8283 / UCD 57-17) TaxID=436907 RepID=A7TKC5_VANPO|nr:uncharacterized protein Kpol_538p12 [Vanderwaltozyma polyspora DSM 70294]EDO17252.1 hypothetical protein Kpol_538p12 [Vanderwaltozyma polyspora DSM 70294]
MQEVKQVDEVTIAKAAAANDEQKVLCASYLKKKSTLGSKPLSKNSASSIKKTTSNGDNNENSNYQHHHSWWPKHSDTNYWCVLRKNQFSYYKTRDEREAVNVIPKSQILGFRLLKDSRKMLIYTKDKILRFKMSGPELIKHWETAFNQFLEVERNKTIEDTDSSNINNITETHVDDEDEEDDDFDILDGPKHSSVQDNDVIKENNKNIRNIEPSNANPDKQFYETYDPRNPEHIILKGVIYAYVKTRFNRTKWKKVDGVLSNRSFDIYSVKSSRLKSHIGLDTVIDCVEMENPTLDTMFALVTEQRRLKFRAFNDQEMVDWIIHFKSCVLVRQKIKSHVKT